MRLVRCVGVETDGGGCAQIYGGETPPESLCLFFNIEEKNPIVKKTVKKTETSSLRKVAPSQQRVRLAISFVSPLSTFWGESKKRTDKRKEKKASEKAMALYTMVQNRKKNI